MTDLCQPTAAPCFAAVAVVPVRRLREQSDNYPRIITRIDAKHRIIECRDRLQWVLQRLIGKRWRGVSSHRDRAALIKRSAATGTALAILRALPPTHMGGAHR